MRKLPRPREFRSSEYDALVAYYERTFHNKTPDELGERGLKRKLSLRAWLNEEQTKRRRPHHVQGLMDARAPRQLRQRFRQPP